jgi:hypothetical protein
VRIGLKTVSRRHSISRHHLELSLFDFLPSHAIECCPIGRDEYPIVKALRISNEGKILFHMAETMMEREQFLFSKRGCANDKELRISKVL